MEQKNIEIRCQSCGAGLRGNTTTGTVACVYCGAQFLLPDPTAEPDLYTATFRHGYDVDGDPLLKKAIRWVNKGRPKWFPALSSFGTSLDLHLCRIRGRGLNRLAGLQNLRKLDLCHTKIRDSHLAALAPLKNLEFLRLEMCDVTDACIPHLEKLPCLEHLNIKTTDITPEGTLKLSLLPNIRKLEIDGSGNKNFLLFRAGVAEKCFELNDISLTFENMTDDDLEYLAKYNQIRNLDLRVNKITGSGLKHLKDFQYLMSLNLSQNPITDENLAHLVVLPRLRALELESTKVTDAGAALLKKQMPKLQVRYKT